MNLRAAAVNRKMKAYQDVIRLLKTAFPVEEQYPVWFLRLLALRKEVNFLAFHKADRKDFAEYPDEKILVLNPKYVRNSKKFEDIIC